MKNRLNILYTVVFGCLLGFSAPAVLAKTIYYGTSAESLTVGYGQRTILRFDDPVKTISNASDFVIRPLSDDSPDYSVLSVEPRLVKSKTDVTFILSSGDTVALRISVQSADAKSKPEGIYDLRSQKDLIATKSEALPYVGKMDLMTAMIQGAAVFGYDKEELSTSVSSPVGGLKVTLTALYSGDSYKGYVYEMVNTSKEAVEIDLRRLQFGSPNLALLAFSDVKTLDREAGKNKSRLIVVTKPGAFYKNALLPFRTTQKQKAGDDSYEN